MPWRCICAGCRTGNRRPRSWSRAEDALVLDPLQSRTQASLDDLVSSLMYLDSVSYLPGDSSRGARPGQYGCWPRSPFPLLDHRVIEFAWRLTPRTKVRGGQGKWLLRQLLRRHLPSALYDRPKQGFGVPIGEWLRGPLRPWAQSLLEPARLRQGGLLRAEPVGQAWAEHLSARSDRGFALWNVLMFQAWYERWHTRVPGELSSVATVPKVVCATAHA